MGLSDTSVIFLKQDIDISGSATVTKLHHLLSHPTGFLCVGFLQKESRTSERGRDPTHHLTRDADKWKSLREPKLSSDEWKGFRRAPTMRADH